MVQPEQGAQGGGALVVVPGGRLALQLDRTSPAHAGGILRHLTS